MRLAGIGPASKPWEGFILPLYQRRIYFCIFLFCNESECGFQGAYKTFYITNNKIYFEVDKFLYSLIYFLFYG
jgi:hypothetical protein